MIVRTAVIDELILREVELGCDVVLNLGAGLDTRPQRLPLPESLRWIEVDLLARSLKLAVEVDGYHHFHDPAAFRRDRRKDLELQKHGYLVVRVLADDVGQRLEEVMETIVAGVAFRRVEANSLEAKS